MKKLAVIAVGLAAVISTPVMAADIPMKAPAYTPPFIAPYNWTGFYVGGHVGYGWSKKDWTDISATTGLPTGFVATNHPKGVLGGVQGGYNYQLGQWVFGVEGQFSWTDMNGSSPFIEPNGTLSDESVHTDIHWLASLAGRFGFAWDRALVYAKGGAAWVNEHHWQEFNGVQDTNVVSATRTGWTVGGGVEYAFWDRWSAKIEYNYMDFGSHRYPFVATADGRLFPSDIAQKVQTVQIGINYKFY